MIDLNELMDNRFSFLLVMILMTGLHGYAQGSSPQLSIRDRAITTEVPFLLVPSDARSSGMGDIGVATPTDAYSQQWNPAKYAFAKIQQGVAISYIPYLRKLTNDINVGQLNYYNRIDERSAFAGSIRYFNLGEIDAREGIHEAGLILKPNQISIDLSYALKLSEEFAMAVTGRYIRSDLKLQTSIEDASVANSASVDLSGFYESFPINYGNFDGQWRAGFNLSNIGPKIGNGSEHGKGYIPTNLALGGGFDFILNSDNVLGAYVEFNKLLVPTPSDSNGDGIINHLDDYYHKGGIQGIFSSFGDAPGGFSEELKEITWAIGAEYRYMDSFALRAGYFHESPDKGFRQYFTLGAGFTYGIAQIDLSYLFSTADAISNPLEGSLRFSLAFNFGRSY